MENKTNITSGEVGEALIYQIIKGEFSKGSKLPTCRALMQQMGVNKNTVSKAFQALEEQGYVKTVTGKGTFVTYEPFSPATNPATMTFEESINRAIWQARAAGLKREDVTELFNQGMQAHYGNSAVQVMLIECNFKEAQQFSLELSEISDIKIDPVVLGDFLADPESYVKSYQVITATFPHLSEIEEALAPYDKAGLVAINTAVVPDSLMQIARIPRGSKTAIITSSGPVLPQLSGFAQAYNSSLVLSGCLESEDEKLARLIADSDWLVATQTSYPKVSRLAGNKPVIPAVFKIDHQSLVFFSNKVNSLGLAVSQPALLTAARS